MESTQPAAAPRDTATIRSWLKRSIEFEDWSRLTQLAQLLAEKGEYEESIEWLSKVPVGDPRDGKYSSESYYKVITKICENALKHERLDFVERVLDQLFNPEKQSPTSKKFPPMVFDVAIAILEFHLSKGEIDTGLEYLNSHPKSSHASLVHGAAATASDNGHADHVEAFSKRLSDPEMRAICQRMLANHYAWRNEPENIWRLANQIAIDQPDDLMAQVAIRDSAMRSYARSTPDRFAELVPIHRELIAKLPDAEPVPVWDSVESFSSGEPQRRLPDAEQVRYLGDLALYAAYAKRYELAVELSANVPMLTTSGSIFMDLSGSDRHPVLYGITELQKGHEFDRALAIVDRVKNEAVKLASLARLANCTGFGSDRAEHQESYELMVERLTLAYLTFARQHDEATVLDTYDGLPESINIHLQRVSHPSLSPDEVPYFNRGRLLKRSEYFDLLIEQEKIDEVVRHAEDLLSDGDVNGAKWIVTMLGDAGQAEAFERLRAQVKQAFNVQESGDSKAAADIWDYRHFLDQSALSAYYSGQRDLCYETFMKLDRNWMSPSMVSKVAYKAWQSDDMAFLRRMESSPSRLMREAALERLAVHHVLKGDIESVKETSMTFDREFGAQNKSWSIYRTITDDRIITEPTQLLATMQFALQQVPFESNDYAVIAVQRAKLLGQHYPSKPLPAEWLKKLDHNPKLKYQVEVAHAFAL